MVLSRAGWNGRRFLLVFVLVSAAAVLVCTSANAAEGGWQAVLGGKINDYVSYAYQTPNNDYIFVGTTSSFKADSWEALVIRIDENGREIFTKTYGNYKIDDAFFAETLPNGETAVIGTTHPGTGVPLQSFIFSIDDQGKLSKGMRHSMQFVSDIQAVRKDRDGDFIFLEYYSSEDFYLAKVDTEGFFQWSERCCYNEIDIIGDVDLGHGGGYVLAGITQTNDQMQGNMLAVKVDAAGKKVWQKTFGGWYNDGALDVCAAKQGGYVIAGYRGGLFSISEDAAVIKIDEQGNLEWEKYFGGRDIDYITAVHQTRDMGFIVAGTTYSYGEGNADFYAAKLRYNGDIEWETTFGTKRADSAVDIMQTTDGGYLVYGSTKGTGARGYDILVVKLDKDGNSGESAE